MKKDQTILSRQDQHFWHFFSMLTYGIATMTAVSTLYFLDKLPDSIKTFDFALLVLATFRMIRLVTYDLVADYIRDFFAKYETGLGKSIADLLGCPWCVGIWIALVLAFLYLLTPFAWPVIFFIALAGAGSLLSILSSLIMVKIKR